MRPARRRSTRRTRPRRLIRFAVFGAAMITLPSGACVDMATRVTINSFLHGITPVLANQLETGLITTDRPDSP